MPQDESIYDDEFLNALSAIDGGIEMAPGTTPAASETPVVEAAAPTSTPPTQTVAQAADDSLVDDGEDPFAILGQAAVQAQAIAEAPRTAPGASDDQDDASAALSDFQSAAGITKEMGVGDIRKPWMLAHEFVIVQTVEHLREIVDAGIKRGKMALDLETEGLDNRIVINAEGQPETVHKIVGYCLSYDGKTGYYVPVRHVGEGAEGNIKDVAGVEAEIRRLCLESQPILNEEQRKANPIGSKEFETPPRVVIYFWNAKFDQEFLYPITGIGFWHPESFEDGYLVYWCRYTGDKMLSLKKKAEQLLSVKVTPDMAKARKTDAERNWGLQLFKGNEKFIQAPYEMIELIDLFPKGKKRDIKWAELHPEEGRYYACSDAICTMLLGDLPETQATIKDPRFASTYRLEKQVTQAVRKMERNRVLLDLPFVENLIREAKIESEKYHSEIMAVASNSGMPDLDLASPKQLGEFLFGERYLNLEPKPERNEASGQWKTDADTLEELAAMPGVPDILLKIVKWRQIEKVVGTYLESMAKNCPGNEKRIPAGEGRVQFKQTGAPTGRFAAPGGDPDHGFAGFPPHGIPATYDDKKPKVATSLRRCFVGRPGYVVVKVDYAAEELRIVTNLSREPVWMKEFLEGTGDLHSITARAFFGKAEVSKQERQQGKTANFALVYGGGPMAIVRATGCTQQEGARRKQAFDKSVPVFAKWVKTQHMKVKNDLGVATAFNRWMAVPDANSPDRAVQAACERYSLNYPIQGTGADIMKIAMVILHREFFKLGWITDDGRNDIVRILLTVHDELVFEVRKDMLEAVIPVIKSCMEEPGRMARWTVPLIVEPLIDESWDAKYNWDHIWEGEKKAAKPDEKLKSWQFRVGDTIYGIPPFLQGLITPPWLKEHPEAAANANNAPAPPKGDSPAPPTAPTAQAPTPRPAAPTAAPAPKPEEVLVWKLGMSSQTRNAVRLVASAAMFSKNPSGKVLHVVSFDDKTLVDPKLGIKVDPDTFKHEMISRNL